MYRQTLGIVTDTEYVVLTPGATPPPEDWPVTRTLHVFDNVRLKAEWFDISKALSQRIVNIDTNVLLGAYVDYTVKYTQGLPISEKANIAFNDVNIASETLWKAETKSGTALVTDSIGKEAKSTISFLSAPGIWSEVLFEVWITFGFSEEPDKDPSLALLDDWQKWLLYGAIGLVALLVLTRGTTKVIVVKSD